MTTTRPTLYGVCSPRDYPWLCLAGVVPLVAADDTHAETLTSLADVVCHTAQGAQAIAKQCGIPILLDVTALRQWVLGQRYELAHAITLANYAWAGEGASLDDTIADHYARGYRGCYEAYVYPRGIYETPWSAWVQMTDAQRVPYLVREGCLGE